MGVQAVFDYYRSTGGVYERGGGDAAAERERHQRLLPRRGPRARPGDGLPHRRHVSAVFGLPEVSIGIVPSSGGIHRLVRMVGTARARELILARQRFSADEAARIGIVTEVVPAGECARPSLRARPCAQRAPGARLHARAVARSTLPRSPLATSRCSSSSSPTPRWRRSPRRDGALTPAASPARRHVLHGSAGLNRRG